MTDLGRGIFITFEGPEGGGKSTQARCLAEALSDRGFDVLSTREPGGTRIGDIIRHLVLSPEHSDITLRAEALLYAADRAQHVEEVIKPALSRGNIVVCDRYVDSSVVYQGYAGGLGAEWVTELNRLATGGLVPDVTFLLDCPPEVGLARAGQGGALDRIEQRTLEYHRQVRQSYLAIAQGNKERFFVVDSSCLGSQEICTLILSELLNRCGGVLPPGGVRQ